MTTTKIDHIEFEPEELDAATNWHDGQSSMLYAIASTGALSRGTRRPRVDCDECGGRGYDSDGQEPCRACHGARMSDDQWLVYLASNLEGEAEVSADQAREQGDDEEAEALDAIAAKCREAIKALGGEP